MFCGGGGGGLYYIAYVARCIRVSAISTLVQ
jgi:hypothetical protein